MVQLRPPDVVMRLERLGSLFPTRLSFMRTLIRRLSVEGWGIERTQFAIDRQGYGRAVYQAARDGRAYSLVAFSHALDPARRTDRVIAEAWDATFVLFDGTPDEADMARLAENAPKQEAGRYCPRDLVVSRANKSVRFFDHVVDRLAAGLQPDETLLRTVGYLMRTTAVYGNGKFGIADRARIADRPELKGPFQAELLAIYLIRCFTHDLVEHVARKRDPQRAVALEPWARRHIGIGNATGLGMAPFLARHPVLLNNWIAARETALVRVRSVDEPTPRHVARFMELLLCAQGHVAEWVVDDPDQMARITHLAGDIARLLELCEGVNASRVRLWDHLYGFCERHLSIEGQELLVSLLIEVHPELVDDLAEDMSSDVERHFDPRMPTAELQQLVSTDYAWALNVDLEDCEQLRRFWYVSEEKLEPRLGDRYEEPGSDREMPFAIARDVQALHRALTAAPGDLTCAAFLLEHPGFHHVVRRIQTVARCPYAEIRDNLVAARCRPIDLLRCKLSFFGAFKFDPKSDRWTRINMYQGAPLPDELSSPGADDWAFPVLAKVAP